MTTQYRVADSKREEFRKYLEKAGVMDALTKVLVNLYEEPEKPSNALDFLKQHIHGGAPEAADIESLKLEVSELRQKCEQLTAENSDLKQRIALIHEPIPSPQTHTVKNVEKRLSWATESPQRLQRDLNAWNRLTPATIQPPAPVLLATPRPGLLLQAYEPPVEDREMES